MYEMLTGRVPFDADTPVSIALKHMQEKPVEPIKLNPSIPYSVNKIIMKAMEKDLNLRYQSATEMLKDLNMALKDPDGDFVKTSSNEMAYTQRIETIPSEDMSNNNKNNVNSTSKKQEANKDAVEKQGFFKKHKAVKIILIILLVILIPVIGFFGTQAILNIGRVKDVQIPDFSEMTRQEAELAAQEANLQLDISEEFSSDVEEGKVISQDPSYLEGYKVKENSTVKIVVSKGENIKIVPDVVGKKTEEAEEEIKAEELEVEVVEEASSKVQAGYVIRQEPEADEEVNAGETIKIFVSTGIKQITMENVVGQKETDAKKKLTDLGFSVEVEYGEDTSKENGIVLEQSIEEDTTVDDGTEVTITVNKIVETKTISVIINVQKLTGGYTEPQIDTNTQQPVEGITTSPTVDITVNNEVRTNVSKNETAYDGNIKFTGKEGETLEINLSIKDHETGKEIYGTGGKTVKFGSQDTITFE